MKIDRTNDTFESYCARLKRQERLVDLIGELHRTSLSDPEGFRIVTEGAWMLLSHCISRLEEPERSIVLQYCTEHLPAFVTRSMEHKWPMIDDGFPFQTIQEVA